MRRRLLVLMVALTMIATISITVGPAWAQNHGGGCAGHEGDHGMGCILVVEDECEDDAWQPLDMFENLFGNQDWCAYSTEQVSTHYNS